MTGKTNYRLFNAGCLFTVIMADLQDAHFSGFPSNLFYFDKVGIARLAARVAARYYYLVALFEFEFFDGYLLCRIEKDVGRRIRFAHGGSNAPGQGGF